MFRSIVTIARMEPTPGQRDYGAVFAPRDGLCDWDILSRLGGASVVAAVGDGGNDLVGGETVFGV